METVHSIKGGPQPPSTPKHQSSFRKLFDSLGTHSLSPRACHQNDSVNSTPSPRSHSRRRVQNRTTEYDARPLPSPERNIFQSSEPPSSKKRSGPKSHIGSIKAIFHSPKRDKTKPLTDVTNAARPMGILHAHTVSPAKSNNRSRSQRRKSLGDVFNYARSSPSTTKWLSVRGGNKQSTSERETLDTNPFFEVYNPANKQLPEYNLECNSLLSRPAALRRRFVGSEETYESANTWGGRLAQTIAVLGDLNAPLSLPSPDIRRPIQSIDKEAAPVVESYKSMFVTSPLAFKQQLTGKQKISTISLFFYLQNSTRVWAGYALYRSEREQQ